MQTQSTTPNSQPSTAIQQIGVNDLVTEGLQTRFTLNEETIAEYAEAMRENGPESFPPITVFEDPSSCKLFYLADGFHRVAAARENGYETIAANVTKGSFIQALKFALSANGEHGLRRTGADKRQAMEMAWEQRFMLFPARDNGQGKMLPCGTPTMRQLAEICAVSKGNAQNFLTIKGLDKMSNPLTSDAATTPDSAAESDDSSPLETPAEGDARVVTNQHLEERNASVRALLKEGKDRFGMPIPEKILPAFTSTLITAAVRDLNTVRKTIEQAFLNGIPIAGHITRCELEDLDKGIRGIKDSQPFCVCRACHGSGCSACSNTGSQTKYQYRLLPPELRHGEE